MTTDERSQIIWTPSESRREAANITHFMRWLTIEKKMEFGGYDSLWSWSIDDISGFWGAIWAYFDVKQSAPHASVISNEQMPGAHWFPGSRLNFVEQIFRHTSLGAPALVYHSESIGQGEVSWIELERQVAALAASLRACGIESGDRVAVYLPNIPQAVVAFLAVASIGAVWSVCSPDMGIASVTDRFQQVAPKLLITADGYRFAGKAIDRREFVTAILARLNTIATVLWLPLLDPTNAPSTARSALRIISWQDAVAGRHKLTPLQVAFDHPLWIVYSSGTTGLPKAIVHGHGGVLATGLVTSGLHFDLDATDRFFWYSTTNWIMWNIQVMVLLVGATICLFDGAVTGSNPQPDWSVLWRFVSERRVAFFGSGAAYLAGCAKAGLRPSETTDLTALTTIGSTGSPLSDTSYRWIYDSVKSDIWLTSAAGGTDIAGAFVSGSPTLPVYVGEMQCRSLGAAVYAYDDDGQAVFDEVGELVCVKPMPSMPLYFWNDPGNQRYLESYFDNFTGPKGERIWRHGDWLRLTSRPSAVGAVIYGRSDATINRHGLRMGTSEFYRVIESHPQIIDSIIIDLEYLGRPSYLGLFVALRPGALLTEELKIELKKRLGAELSPRYVPDDIIQIPEVPRTLTGKKLEIPLKRFLLGQPAEAVFKSGAIANPDSLNWFRTFSASRGPCTG